MARSASSRVEYSTNLGLRKYKLLHEYELNGLLPSATAPSVKIAVGNTTAGQSSEVLQFLYRDVSTELG